MAPLGGRGGSSTRGKGIGKPGNQSGSRPLTRRHSDASPAWPSTEAIAQDVAPGIKQNDHAMTPLDEDKGKNVIGPVEYTRP